MSVLDFFEPVIKQHATQSGGEPLGLSDSQPPTLTDGETLRIGFIRKSSIEHIVAFSQDAHTQYTIICSIETPLDYRDFFRRESDGGLYRVSGRFECAPAKSSLRLKTATAERVIT
jgi:hypothetical protein